MIDPLRKELEEKADYLLNFVSKKLAFPEKLSEIERKFMSDVYEITQGYLLLLEKSNEHKEKI